MREYKHNARKALEVYLERGQLAIANLTKGKVEKAEELLRWQTAAFHNFRAFDSLAMSQGFDLSKDYRFIKLWDEVKTVDDQIQSLMAKARNDAQQALIKLGNARGKIGHYRSGLAENPNFARTV